MSNQTKLPGNIIRFLLSLTPAIILYGVVIALVWLGLHYGNGWVIAAGLIYLVYIKFDISIGEDEKK